MGSLRETVPQQLIARMDDVNTATWTHNMDQQEAMAGYPYTYVMQSEKTHLLDSWQKQDLHCPYPSCRKYIKTNMDLLDHWYTRHMKPGHELQLECYLCQNIFSQQRNLKYHLLHVHNIYIREAVSIASAVFETWLKKCSVTDCSVNMCRQYIDCKERSRLMERQQVTDEVHQEKALQDQPILTACIKNPPSLIPLLEISQSLTAVVNNTAQDQTLEKTTSEILLDRYPSPSSSINNTVQSPHTLGLPTENTYTLPLETSPHSKESNVNRPMLGLPVANSLASIPQSMQSFHNVPAMLHPESQQSHESLTSSQQTENPSESNPPENYPTQIHPHEHSLTPNCRGPDITLCDEPIDEHSVPPLFLKSLFISPSQTGILGTHTFLTPSIQMYNPAMCRSEQLWHQMESELERMSKEFDF